MQTSNQARWILILLFVTTVVLLKNISLGAFVQLEASQIHGDSKGQTYPVEAGWPFPVLATEAYTLNFRWYAERHSTSRHWAEICADFFLSIIVIWGASSELSRIAQLAHWQPTIRDLLAVTATCACVLTGYKIWEFSLHPNGIGDLSMAAFYFVDSLILLFVLLTWHWLFLVIGKALPRRFPAAQQAVSHPID